MSCKESNSSKKSLHFSFWKEKGWIPEGDDQELPGSTWMTYCTWTFVEKIEGSPVTWGSGDSWWDQRVRSPLTLRVLVFFFKWSRWMLTGFHLIGQRFNKGLTFGNISRNIPKRWTWETYWVLCKEMSWNWINVMSSIRFEDKTLDWLGYIFVMKVKDMTLYEPWWIFFPANFS